MCPRGVGRQLATRRLAPQTPVDPVGAQARQVERVNAFNLIISNVPGPGVPLYYAGARLLAYYPLSAIADGQGLNITVMSYGGALHFGLIADRDLVPDLDAMAGFLADELTALTRAVVHLATEATPAQAPAPAAEATPDTATAERTGSALRSV